MKSFLNTLLICVAVIVSVWILTSTYSNRKKIENVINVTGMGKKDFISDLIVWNAAFNRINMDLKTAYSQLKSDKDIIYNYLVSKGINEKEILFESIEINKDYDEYYDKEHVLHRTFKGYRLSQSLEIESSELDKIEAVSREVTELINAGIELYSSSPRFYYTKLAELKIEMIAAAAEDARVRAEKIAQNSNASLGDLKNASMGVFQITGQNSDDDFSWGGSLNTSSKKKTATITMRLKFGVK